VHWLLFLATASLAVAQELTPEKLIEAGHWKQARTLVERRLSEAPNDANAAYLASQVRNAFGDRSSPPDLAGKAVRLDGGVARYHRQLAEVYGVMAQHAGMFQQLMLARRFRKEIDAAISLDPRDAQALRDLLEFYLLAPGIAGGDTKKADGVAQKIAAVDRREGFLAEARIAEFRKDRTRTESMLRKAVEVSPPSYRANMVLAQFHLAPDHRNEDAAEAVARTALQIDSGRSGAYCVLAAIYAARGNWSMLDATLASAIREVPDDYAPYYRAAEALLANGRDAARAERYLQSYLTQEPEGNQPTAAEARAKLELAQDRLRNVDAVSRPIL
jgi:tetratricopeptide (TPR) repeat protein